jgi:DNA-binding NarL/FixJ family response regulator
MGTQLLSEVLSRDRRFQPVSANSVEEIASVNIDVALIADTARLESFQGPALIHEIRRRRPDLSVVVLVEQSNREAVVDAVRAGARGVLCRTEPIKTIGKCVSCVYNGQLWANQKELEYLLQALTDPVPIRLVDAKGAALLSAREQDVVRWVAEGLTNREIADRLELSEHTIKNYLFRIFEKLGISNRTELILYVISQVAPHRAVSSGGDDTHNGNHSSDKQLGNMRPWQAYVLAERYLRGEGVPKDNTSAYMWFEVAKLISAELMGKTASALADLGTHMSAEQMAEARSRAVEWLSREEGNGNHAKTAQSVRSPESAA